MFQVIVYIVTPWKACAPDQGTRLGLALQLWTIIKSCMLISLVIFPIFLDSLVITWVGCVASIKIKMEYC